MFMPYIYAENSFNDVFASGIALVSEHHGANSVSLRQTLQKDSP